MSAVLPIPLSVRLAAQSDIPAMIALVNAAFVVESFLEGTRTDEDRMTALMQQGTFLVALAPSGRMVASVYTEKRGERSYLGMLAVSPELQGQGLGRLMVESAEHHSREQGSRAMDLTVLSLRAELLPFYGKLGYELVGTDPFHPPRPLKPGLQCHCIRLSKVL
jgi:ribosomal protein S18 acetylase RimI-like enzyme